MYIIFYIESISQILLLVFVMFSTSSSSRGIGWTKLIIVLLFLPISSVLHIEAVRPDFSSSNSSSLFRPPKVHVIISNGLDHNLTLHCKSSDDDIGIHHLSPAMNWDFKFRKNIFSSTLFFCSFKWSNQFHYFDVYDSQRDEKHCIRECPWTVGSTGLCLFGAGKCYPWNK